MILGLHPANKRRGYKVMQSLIGWVQMPFSLIETDQTSTLV